MNKTFLSSLAIQLFCAAVVFSVGAAGVDPPQYVPGVICARQEKVNGQCPGSKAKGASGAAGSADDANAAICDGFIPTIEKCLDETYEAEKDSCNPNNKEMESASSWLRVVATLLAANTATSVQASCGKVKDVSQFANGALVAFQTKCMMSNKSCTSACELAISMVNSNPTLDGCAPGGANRLLHREKLKCAKSSVTLEETAGRIAAIAVTENNASRCAEMTASNLQSFCQSNAKDPMCAQVGLSADCSNATTAATNTTCICAANPRDPRCGGAGTTSASTSGSGPNGGNPSGGSPSDKISAADLAAGNLNLGGALGDDSFDGNVPGGKGSQGNQPGGAKGVGRNIGGGDGPAAGPGKQAPQAASSGANTKISSGFYGGSGGGFGGAGSGSGSSGGSGYNGGGGGPAGKPGIDLKQFLPGGQQDPSRGIAGISGPDGITGPNSDLWAKVNVRYRTVGPNMKP